MTPERWQQIKSVLADAREQKPEERPLWLEEVCADDDDLRQEVESFLQEEENLEGFIDEPVLSVVAGLAEDLDTLTGRKVGPYRLVRLLGRGGMGVVYLAHREEEFEQEVALKLMPHPLADSDMIRRFQDERQILARLDHPNIARLLDGGTTDEGVPYFAMEYVEGMTLDVYCDHHRLSTRERLTLFLDICSALETAHQSLVVHRDLKPGNILVDAAGRPKLLDFGIAKLLEADETNDTRTTTQKALTFNYAGPEQVQGHSIGTAADIYSLGVVLYKILTGRLPGELENLPQLEKMITICQQDPMLPSVAVGQSVTLEGSGDPLNFTPESASKTRDGDPASLRKALTGDVDSIVMKALRKEPSERYASMGHMADDIERYLQGMPVEARQGDRLYRIMKWTRRYRWGVAAGLAMVGLALAFTLALATQLKATEQAKERSELVSNFLIDLFQSAAPDRPAGEEPTLRDLLDRGREQLESGLDQEPEAEATLSLRLGGVYSKLGAYDEAAELTARAVARLRMLHKQKDHTELARALNDLAVVRYHQRDLEQAGKLFAECIDMRKRLGEEQNLTKPMNNLAAIQMARKEFAEAEQIYRESLKLRASAPPGERTEINLAKNQRNLAMALLAQNDLDEAENLLQSALTIREKVHGRQNPMVANVLLSLGRVEQLRGNYDEAEVLLKEGLGIRQGEFGEDHRYSALAEVDLASVYVAQDDTENARSLLTRALQTLREVRPEGDWEIAEADGLLGAVLLLEGKTEEAQRRLGPAYEILVAQRGPDSPETRHLKLYWQRLPSNTEIEEADP